MGAFIRLAYADGLRPEAPYECPSLPNAPSEAGDVKGLARPRHLRIERTHLSLLFDLRRAGTRGSDAHVSLTRRAGGPVREQGRDAYAREEPPAGIGRRTRARRAGTAPPVPTFHCRCEIRRGGDLNLMDPKRRPHNWIVRDVKHRLHLPVFYDFSNSIVSNNLIARESRSAVAWSLR
jgi:hypothetical protein